MDSSFVIRCYRQGYSLVSFEKFTFNFSLISFYLDIMPLCWWICNPFPLTLRAWTERAQNFTTFPFFWPRKRCGWWNWIFSSMALLTGVDNVTAEQKMWRQGCRLLALTLLTIQGFYITNGNLPFSPCDGFLFVEEPPSSPEKYNSKKNSAIQLKNSIRKFLFVQTIYTCRHRSTNSGNICFSFNLTIVFLMLSGHQTRQLWLRESLKGWTWTALKSFHATRRVI